ncbi:hypothetical protein HFO56_23740 [Rhizobium laguerreae]|uniref:hypothetical protein n=1 Tax=Rhizobium laguerreae TaxID=1076926 RepID=UPI001C9174B1|nr:hypothetical protein [Rhizobium laguerreae]MBY3155340.1 hypothetical protein [Rhizobium laguerreae]MBY3432617.1 hypothetical protein [Rhizobium laguerreae]
MGVVVDIDSFRHRRKASGQLESVACPLCGVRASGAEHGGDVVYVCDGSLTDHGKLEWSHSREHVFVRTAETVMAIPAESIETRDA